MLEWPGAVPLPSGRCSLLRPEPAARSLRLPLASLHPPLSLFTAAIAPHWVWLLELPSPASQPSSWFASLSTVGTSGPHGHPMASVRVCAYVHGGNCAWPDATFSSGPLEGGDTGGRRFPGNIEGIPHRRYLTVLKTATTGSVRAYHRHRQPLRLYLTDHRGDRRTWTNAYAY